MDSTDNTRPAPAASQFREAYFDNGATSPSDVLLVIIPDFSLDQPFGDPDGVVWSPMGGALPQAGDRALVAESTDGSWWAVSWWSDAQSDAADTDTRLDALEAASATEARGQATATGTGTTFASIAITDNLGTTSKFAVASVHAGGTFSTDTCVIQVQSATTNTTTILAATRGGGTIPNGQTVLIDYRIWK